VHPVQVLFEVIQSGPLLIRPRAAFPEAEVHHLRATLGLFVVHTFLVASQVVDGTKALFTGTVRFITLEKLSMACLVFPGQVRKDVPIELVSMLIGYLLSDGHFPTHEQEGWSHLTEPSSDDPE